MDTEKQHDTEDREQTGPLRLLGYVFRTPADTGESAVDPHQVVHSQEPLWVLHLRFIDADGNDATVIRIVLRPTATDGWWPGRITYLYDRTRGAFFR